MLVGVRACGNGDMISLSNAKPPPSTPFGRVLCDIPFASTCRLTDVDLPLCGMSLPSSPSLVCPSTLADRMALRSVQLRWFVGVLAMSSWIKATDLGLVGF